MSDVESRGPVVRVSRGKFDPDRLAQVQEMIAATSSYLIPAISMVNVSVWASDEHATQMATLKEMTVNARRDAAAVGVEFINIVNYPIAWTI